MAPPPQKHKNDSAAIEVLKGSVGLFSQVLYYIGRPFYLLIFYIVLTSIIALSITTGIIEDIIGRLKEIRIPHISLPKANVNVPIKYATSLRRSFVKKKKSAINLRNQINAIISDKFAELPKYLKIKLLKLRLIRFSINLPKAKRRQSTFTPKLKKLRVIIGILTVGEIILLSSFLYITLKDLPSPEELTRRNQEVSTKIYDRNGTLLFTIYKDKNRTPVPLEEIPLQVRLSTLAAEDANFYKHPGFSMKGISRAAFKNVRDKELTGGSTITQQLVKNALLTSDKTLTRKVRELVLSIEVELDYTKDEILEMYLNEVSYGGTAYGIQEAAKVYFDKNVSELTLAESALLAGLPKGPTRYSPFGSHPDLAQTRKDEVLSLMKQHGFINDSQYQRATNEKLTFAENKIDIKAPHFVMYVKQLLIDKYGEEVVEQGGLNVITTLDYPTQLMAEKIVREEIDKLQPLNVSNGAAIVMDPKTGEILAMVGSKDYFDTAHDGNVNTTLRLRQPGSSIKVVNYAYALSHGMTPTTKILDTPTSFNIPGQAPYSPKNYDGKYRGSITLRSALAESRNIPAVKVLSTYGVDRMIDLGQEMGITTWNNRNRFGLSLTLGGGEVKLLDMASVYSTLANYGQKPETIAISKVTNYKGKVLEETKCIDSDLLHNFSSDKQDKNCDQKQVVDPRVAYMLTDILKDNNARSPAFGSHSLLNIQNHPEVAVKTGTSNNLRDNLAIGYNQDYLVAVWVGNNDNSPMSRIASGITGATPIWHNIMSSLLSDKQAVDWSVPDGLVHLPVCTITGTLTCSNCPTREDWFLDENAPTVRCSNEFIAKVLGEDNN